LADYSYPDGLAALELLQTRTRKMRQQVIEADSYSAATRTAIHREANFLIVRITYIVGMIVRSTSVRNAFELYVPFLDLCKALVGRDARLLISSEWQYVPFTHPQSLAELPDFIIIGLPAPESDNVLVFPAAGHELGHSVWSKRSLVNATRELARQKIDAAFIKNQERFRKAFPDLRDADLDQDLFVQFIKASALGSALSQIEETFSDFLGLLLFGESYLYAFEYLVAPQLSGVRSTEYPDTLNRTKVLERYASEKLGIAVPQYTDAFVSEAPKRSAPDIFMIEIADAVVEDMLAQLFTQVEEIVKSAKLQRPTDEVTGSVAKSFANGVPFDEEATIGDLVNAAWRIFRSSEDAKYEQQGRARVDYLADLVMKSIEIYEIRKHLT
jgi:hypothetical protein